MKMLICRICKSTSNLIYTLKEIRILRKRKQAGQELPLNISGVNFGNICHECEQRLNNYNRMAIVGATTPSGNRKRSREDSPVIVDDDEALYKEFFGENNKHRRIVEAKRKTVQQTLVRRDLYDELTRNSLGSDGATEVVEVLTSGSSTPEPAAENESTASQIEVNVIDQQPVVSSDLYHNLTQNFLSSNGAHEVVELSSSGASTPVPLAQTDVNIIEITDSETEIEEAIEQTPTMRVNDISRLLNTVVTPIAAVSDGSVSHTPMVITLDEAEASSEAVLPSEKNTKKVKIIKPKRVSKGKVKKRSVNTKEFFLMGEVNLVSSDSSEDEAAATATSPSKAIHRNSSNLPKTISPVASTSAAATRRNSSDVEEILTPTNQSQSNSHTSRNFVCQHCDVHLPNADSLQMHTRIHALRNPTENVSHIGQTFQCSHCSIRLPDFESLQVHGRVHVGLHCPACQKRFLTNQRLVLHMRVKHRQHDDEEYLSERPRCAKDSAMTIRLRFLKNYFYFECQLCGRIDSVYRDHTQHIMNQHADEARSLRDPMMSEFRCPVCNVKCGTNLMVCKHLLKKHAAEEYEKHLQEVKDLSSFKWHKVRQKEIESTARVYQFTKRKNCYFECRDTSCGKVLTGYLNYFHHLNTHRKKSTEVESSNKNNETQQADKVVPVRQQAKKRKRVTSKRVIQTKKTTKKMQLDKQKTKAAVVPKKVIRKVITAKRQLKKQDTKKQLKEDDTTAETVGDKNNDSDNDRPNFNFIRPLRKTEQPGLFESPEKAAPQAKKLTKKAVRAKLTLVKVKPILRHIGTKHYRCKYCGRLFKGFTRLNSHVLTLHKDKEFRRCTQCSASFISEAVLAQHLLAHKEGVNKRQRKRKCTTQENDATVLKINADVVTNENSGDSSEDDRPHEISWRQIMEDLLLKNAQRTNTVNVNLNSVDEPIASTSKAAAVSSTVMNAARKNVIFDYDDSSHKFAIGSCGYCTRLFANEDELKKHEEDHAMQQHVIMLRYTPLNSTAKPKKQEKYEKTISRRSSRRCSLKKNLQTQHFN